MNFAREIVDASPSGRGSRSWSSRARARGREWSFGEVAERSARLAGALAQRGVGRGDVVMTLIGNRPEWVLSMVACFRIGAVVLPCTEQLRAKDLRLRIDVAEPTLIVADERNRRELEAAWRRATARRAAPARRPRRSSTCPTSRCTTRHPRPPSSSRPTTRA